MVEYIVGIFICACKKYMMGKEIIRMYCVHHTR